MSYMGKKIPEYSVKPNIEMIDYALNSDIDIVKDEFQIICLLVWMRQYIVSLRVRERQQYADAFIKCNTVLRRLGLLSVQ